MRKVKRMKKSMIRAAEKQSERMDKKIEDYISNTEARRASWKGHSKAYFTYRPHIKSFQSKDFWLEKLDKEGRLLVDCSGRPPSSIFKREIKKGMLKREREGRGTCRRTLLVKT